MGEFHMYGALCIGTKRKAHLQVLTHCIAGEGRGRVKFRPRKREGQA